MQSNRVSHARFQTAHSCVEITNYIMDLDAPKLTLDVRPWYNYSRIAYSLLMVTVTILSCVLMLVTSLPEYYFEDMPDRGLSVSWIPILELICVLYFTLDYIIRLMVTHRDIWPDFLLDGFNIIDLITIIPFYLELIANAAQGSGAGLGVLFFVRALRLAKLGRYSVMLMSVLDSVQATYDVLLLFLLCYVIVVFNSGTLYFYAENQFTTRVTTYRNDTSGFEEHKVFWVRPCPSIRQFLPTKSYVDPVVPTNLIWMTDNVSSFRNGSSCAWVRVPADATGSETAAVGDVQLVEISPVQNIPDAVYWAFVVTSTLGTRSNAPVTVGARVVCGFTVFLGVLLFAVPVTVLTASFRQIRRKQEAQEMFRKIDIRTTVAMKAQEKLKRELTYAQRNRENVSDAGSIRFIQKRTLEKVGTFMFEGVERPIFRADLRTYHYPALILLERDSESGAPIWTDDFNPTTSQRIVSCLVILDCDEAQQAARDALVDANVIPDIATDNDIIITADPRSVITARHDFKCSFDKLASVVEFDFMRDINASYREVVPLRFVITMSHVYPSGPVIQLLKETRVVVTVLTPMHIDEVDMPLATDIVMASRFVRELSQIAYRRPIDGALLAYIHHSDGAELLRGFTEQFVPTPTCDDIILDPYFVDTQLFYSLTASLPRIGMEQIPPEAAAAFYRGKHLSVDLSEEPLILVNVSALSQWDLLGFGRRFRVTVPMAKVEKTEISIQLC